MIEKEKSFKKTGLRCMMTILAQAIRPANITHFFRISLSKNLMPTTYLIFLQILSSFRKKVLWNFENGAVLCDI